MAIQLANKTIEMDEEGFLLDPNAWDECVAEGDRRTGRYQARCDAMGIDQLLPDVLR